MIGGIVTILALLGFLAVVVYVFIIKRREDFDEQARQPLEDRTDDRDDQPDNHRNEREIHRDSGSPEGGEKKS